MRRAATAVVLVISLGVLGFAQGGVDKTVQVTGKLVRVAGPGGETTGWTIELEKPLTIKGKQLKQIEVKFDPKQLDPLENKRVTATGKLTQMTGVERGTWPVLELSSIRELQQQ